MKTLLIADSVTRENHVGEEYDDFLEVARVPSQVDIDQWADRIKQHIRKLWGDDGVTVFLDVTPPYEAVVLSLQVVMKRDEKIEFVLAEKK